MYDFFVSLDQKFNKTFENLIFIKNDKNIFLNKIPKTKKNIPTKDKSNFCEILKAYESLNKSIRDTKAIKSIPAENHCKGGLIWNNILEERDRVDCT